MKTTRDNITFTNFTQEDSDGARGKKIFHLFRDAFLTYEKYKRKRAQMNWYTWDESNNSNDKIMIMAMRGLLEVT